MKLRQIAQNDLDRTVWRYLPFSKFVSMLTYQAIWFSKLNILQDKYEGTIPVQAKKQLQAIFEPYKKVLNTPEMHEQIDSLFDKNEESGRELLVVSCWFLSEIESQRMWDEYGGSNEAVAIKSTIGRLSKFILVPRDEHISHLGLVSYVDHDAHEMTPYEANQAIERAFVKDKAKFSHEQEVRLATMNFKTTACVSPEGLAYTPNQVAGAGTNNFENPGLYVGAFLDRLITEVVVCPTAPEWFAKLVFRIVQRSGLPAAVSRSALSHA